MKNSTLILKLAVTLLFLGAFLTRCASIMSPEGGPKDTLPPVITNITPGNFKTNFTDNLANRAETESISAGKWFEFIERQDSTYREVGR